MSCTVIPNHCHLRVIMVGTWEAGGLGKPHVGQCVHLAPRFGTVTLRPGLVSHLGTQAWGQLHFRSAPSTPAGSPSWFFSQSWWLHLCLFGVGPACSSPEGPWDLWAGLGCSVVSECVRHYLEGRGEESGQVRGGSWLHGVRDLGSLDGRATGWRGPGRL